MIPHCQQDAARYFPLPPTSFPPTGTMLSLSHQQNQLFALTFRLYQPQGKDFESQNRSLRCIQQSFQDFSPLLLTYRFYIQKNLGVSLGVSFKWCWTSKFPPSGHYCLKATKLYDPYNSNLKLASFRRWLPNDKLGVSDAGKSVQLSQHACVIPIHKESMSSQDQKKQGNKSCMLNKPQHPFRPIRWIHLVELTYKGRKHKIRNIPVSGIALVST